MPLPRLISGLSDIAASHPYETWLKNAQIMVYDLPLPKAANTNSVCRGITHLGNDIVALPRTREALRKRAEVMSDHRDALR